jgi:prefoldin subunit 5
MSSDVIQIICKQIDELKQEVNTLETKVDELRGEVTAMKDSYNTTITLTKYVITPLLFILGALVGVKIALP